MGDVNVCWTCETVTYYRYRSCLLELEMCFVSNATLKRMPAIWMPLLQLPCVTVVLRVIPCLHVRSLRKVCKDKLLV